MCCAELYEDNLKINFEDEQFKMQMSNVWFFFPQERMEKTRIYQNLSLASMVFMLS